jgi:hypothetical protein
MLAARSFQPSAQRTQCRPCLPELGPVFRSELSKPPQSRAQLVALPPTLLALADEVID